MKILKAFSILCFLSFLLYLILDANLPFVGPFGNNNATYSIQAKNYIKLGFRQTKLAPVNKIEDNKIQYYLHHPPLLQILTALSYKVFGQNCWWPGRFFPIVSTLFSIILMTIIAKDHLGPIEGWLVLFLASTSPFLFSFGKIIQFEPLLLCVSLFFLYIAIKNPSDKLNPLLVILSVIGSLIDWPMIIFLIVVYLIGITSKPDKFKLYLQLSFIILIFFASYASWLSGIKELVGAYLGRGFGEELFGKTWAILKLIILLFLRIIIYFTPLGLLSAIYFFLEKRKDKIVSIYLFFGGINILLFLNGAYAHPYWLYYLTPFFIFTSAKTIKKILDQKKWWWLGVGLLIINTVFSVLIMRYKDQQVKKALWQNEFIDQVMPLLRPEEEIGISWDFNEELFRYKTGRSVVILWSKEEIFKNTLEKPRWRFFIFSCWANCNSNDVKVGEVLANKFEVVLKEKNNRSFLFDLTKTNTQAKDDVKNIVALAPEENFSLLFLYYRKIRNFLGVNQI